ncbi:MAG: gephyrin-like molybdotransferase Glp [Candidatus Njordarchaeia archaeon]
MNFKDPRLKGFQRFEYIDEALKKFISSLKLKPMGVEEIAVEDALGRVLGEDIISSIDIPPFSRAAMDGYAVIAEDTFGASQDNPIRLRIIGESSPGNPFEGEIKKGTAVKISTGAKMPGGANAVVMVEKTGTEGEFVDIFSGVGALQNVAKKGEDVKKGEVILRKGTVLEPFDLSILNYIGLRTVKVKAKPRVVIGATGSELVDVEHFEDAWKSGRFIVETNRIMIKSMVRQLGGTPIDIGIIEDDPDKIKGAIQKWLNEADIIILTGGSSVGKYDYIPKIINELGEPGVVVHGVTAHPGRPVALASINGKPIVNLPGYPVAAYIDFMLFVPPVIHRLLGINGEYVPTVVRAILDAKIPSKPGTRTFARVKITKKEDGYHAIPVRITGAGVLSSLTKAHGFVIVPEDLEGYDKGEEVEVLLFRRFI